MPSEGKVVNFAKYGILTGIIGFILLITFLTLSKDNTKLKDNLPELEYSVKSFVSGPTAVKEGMIIKAYSSSTPLQLKPWGLPNPYKIDQVDFNGFQFLRISGNESTKAVGFLSQPLSYHGGYISLFVGKVNKTKDDHQVSFSFDVRGKNGFYKFVFVQGNLKLDGWRGNIYYKKITPNSSTLIDSERLISEKGDFGSIVNRITIVIQPNVKLNDFEFQIDLGKSTENTPTILPVGSRSFVLGRVIHEKKSLTDSGYIFHDLRLSRFVELNYPSIPSNSSLLLDDWKLAKKEYRNSGADSSSDLQIFAIKEIDMKDLPSAILNMDIYETIINLDSKDYLLISIIAAVILVFLTIPRKNRIHGIETKRS